MLATSRDFPDALAGGPLAARLGAPLLLTPPGQLPGAVAAELQRLGVTTVWLLGGSSAVSPTVEAGLVAAGYTVNRLGGANRFATAALVADEAGMPDGEVVIALGAHPDPNRAWPTPWPPGRWAPPGSSSRRRC